MNIHKQTIERITITGPREESQRAFDYCEKHGYWVTYSGPLPDGKHHVDVTRYRVVAEREV